MLLHDLLMNIDSSMNVTSSGIEGEEGRESEQIGRESSILHVFQYLLRSHNILLLCEK